MSTAARRSLAILAPVLIALVAAAVTLAGTQAAFTASKTSAVATLSGGSPIRVTDCHGTVKTDLAWTITNAYPGQQVVSPTFCLENTGAAQYTVNPKATIATNGKMFTEGLRIVLRNEGDVTAKTTIHGVLRGAQADTPGTYAFTPTSGTGTSFIRVPGNSSMRLHLVWELPKTAGNPVAGKNMTVSLTFPS